MRTILTPIFILFFLFSSGQSEKLVNIWVEIGCGFSGAVSPEFDVIKSFIRNHDLTGLKSCLTATNTLQQLLAVVAINKMLAKDSILLAREELEYLRKFQKKKGYVTVCIGCTEVYRSRITTFFRKDKLPARLAIENELAL